MKHALADALWSGARRHFNSAATKKRLVHAARVWFFARRTRGRIDRQTCASQKQMKRPPRGSLSQIYLRFSSRSMRSIKAPLWVTSGHFAVRSQCPPLPATTDDTQSPKQKDRLATVSLSSNHAVWSAGAIHFLTCIPNFNSERRTLAIGPPWELRHTLPPEPRGRGRAAQRFARPFHLLWKQLSGRFLRLLRQSLRPTARHPACLMPLPEYNCENNRDTIDKTSTKKFDRRHAAKD